jgi:hypothetical protein
MEDWEPIMEKWDCALKVSSIHNDPIEEPIVTVDSSSTFPSLSSDRPPPMASREKHAESGLSILLCSPSILNVNFSKQMLSTLLRTLRTWTAEIEQDEADSAIQKISSRKKASDQSYYIRNLTGFNVYWTAFKEGQVDSEPNIHVMADNVQQPLGALFKRRGRRIGAAAEYRMSVVDNYFVSMEVEYVPPPIPVTPGWIFLLVWYFLCQSYVTLFLV